MATMIRSNLFQLTKIDIPVVFESIGSQLDEKLEREEDDKGKV